MSTKFSPGVLSRRLKAGAGGNTPGVANKAPSMGAPGPRGGKSKLAPYDKKNAGSMFKKNPEVGRVFKKLHNAKNPR